MWKILCVDDDEDSCHLLSEWFRLTDRRCSVDTAATAEEAKQLIVEREYDLFLLDLWLPSVGGDDLCRWIRSRDLRTPIFVISAAATANSKRRAFNAGADEFLAKPGNLARLTELAKQYIEEM